MKFHPKRIFLHLCKWLGLFHLSHYLYRRRLQILCYHGFAYRDENEFMPGLFMHPDVFRRRMRWLANGRFNVVSLDEGVKRLKDDTLPDNSVVITADDGFRSIGDLAVPLTRSLDLPFTIYVTTYYMDKPSPIFRLAVQYMVWKSEAGEDALAGLAREVVPEGWQPGKTGSDVPMWRLIDYAEAEMSEAARVALCRRVGEQLGIDYDDISRAGMLSLMTPSEIRELAERGIDIQLHTHRHALPESPEAVEREIRENRERLEPLAGKSMTHFCYPSGIWSRAHFGPLKQLGIESATTCDPGMNTADTPALALNRYLDRDNVSQIEFEAELRGFKELLRDLKRRVRGEPVTASARVAENTG